MGMFDYIRVLYPMPKGAPRPEDNWQTKDTPEQYLAVYEIREDGSLWLEDQRQSLTGAVNFYTFTDDNDVSGSWWEFCALYDDGKFLSMREIRSPNIRATEAKP
jgi:hypothetical protein